MLKSAILKALLIYFTLGSVVIGFVVFDHATIKTGNAEGLTQVNTVAKEVTDIPSDTVISGNPVKLLIPRLNISLDIIGGTYNSSDSSWLLTNNKAQFATVTSKPNNKTGNTLIYGHDTTQVFKGTDGLMPGDELLIYTDNSHIFRYAYINSTITVPTDTSIFAYQGPPQVTLLTCNGWFSTNRRLMYFTFINIDQ